MANIHFFQLIFLLDFVGKKWEEIWCQILISD